MSCRRHVFEKLELPLNQSVHAGLWLDKFLKAQKYLDKTAGEQARADLIRDLANIRVPKGYKTSFERWKQSMIEDPTIRLLRGKVEGRIAVGLGDRGSTEIGLSLHHTWGVPYIPGSALKGVTARAAHQLTGDDRWKIDKGEWSNELFGSNDEQGLVHFLDAKWDPKGGGKYLYKDILTSHHQDYYTKSQTFAPSDMDSPNPVSFISTTGEFLIAIQCSDAAWLNITEKFLIEGLATLGVGSKTSAGYGYLTVEEDSDALEHRKEQESIAEAEAEQKEEEEHKNRLMALSPIERAKDIISQAEGKRFLASKWYDWLLSDEIILDYLPKFSDINDKSEFIRWLQEQFGLEAKINDVVPNYDKDRKTKILALKDLFKADSAVSKGPFGSESIPPKLLKEVAKEKGSGKKAKKVKKLKSMLDSGFGKFQAEDVKKAILFIEDTGHYSENLIKKLKEDYRIE